MRERPKDGAPGPLPRGWLPDPQPSEGDPKWNPKIEWIMAAAGPELRRLRSRRSAAVVPWWSGMVVWWKPAGALAAVSIVLVLLIQRPHLREPPPSSIALGLVASEGDPVTLWRALGVQAHPVLALIAIQEQRNVAGQNSRPPSSEESR